MSGFTYNDELCHHGIKGQKWGIRRYQNEDGSLTDAGKKKILKTLGYGYLNPSRKDIKKKKAFNRELVANQYAKEYWDKVKKGMPEHGPSKTGKKLWEKYKERYAQATLKDLKMNDTKKARAEVRQILKEHSLDYIY